MIKFIIFQFNKRRLLPGDYSWEDIITDCMISDQYLNFLVELFYCTYFQSEEYKNVLKYIKILFRKSWAATFRIFDINISFNTVKQIQICSRNNRLTNYVHVFHVRSYNTQICFLFVQKSSLLYNNGVNLTAFIKKIFVNLRINL